LSGFGFFTTLCTPNSSETPTNGVSRAHCLFPNHHSYTASTTGNITASSLHLYASQKQIRLQTHRLRAYRFTLSRQKSPHSTSNTYIGFHTASNSAM
jgi:hypothetical protein